MAWAFEAYATGDWTIRTPAGRADRPRPRRPFPAQAAGSEPLQRLTSARLLRNPYYIGIVRYHGVLYPGKHEPLVDPETWQTVQELLTAKQLRRRESTANTRTTSRAPSSAASAGAA